MEARWRRRAHPDVEKYDDDDDYGDDDDNDGCIVVNNHPLSWTFTICRNSVLNIKSKNEYMQRSVDLFRCKGDPGAGDRLTFLFYLFSSFKPLPISLILQSNHHHLDGEDLKFLGILRCWLILSSFIPAVSFLRLWDQENLPLIHPLSVSITIRRSS